MSSTVIFITVTAVATVTAFALAQILCFANVYLVLWGSKTVRLAEGTG